MTQAATSASAPDGYLRTTGASTSQTAGTTWVWASTTTRISPFEYTRALRRSYPPECETVRPSNRTVVGKGRSLPGLRTSLTRIAPSLQKNTSRRRASHLGQPARHLRLSHASLRMRGREGEHQSGRARARDAGGVGGPVRPCRGARGRLPRRVGARGRSRRERSRIVPVPASV